MTQTHPGVHPSTIIENGAKIGKNVQIGPFCWIGPNVTLEDDVSIKSHVCIDGYTTIGQGTTIWPQAVIGTKTQDLKFRGEKTIVKIGKYCEIRECVTINSSCGENTTVEVGDKCLIMAACHIAHNCVLGNRVIMANGALLAGHVTVEDCAIIGGMSAVHQFSRIGCYAMIGGMSRVIYDVLPYSLVAGSPCRVGGLNLVGLKRHGFDLPIRKEMTKAFRLLYRSGLSIQEALQEIQETVEPIAEVRHMVQFCKQTKRGLIGMHGIRASEAVQQAKSEQTEELVVG